MEGARLSGIPPDSELIERALQGDSGAFAALCERHRTRVWRIVASVTRGPDREDLAQEAVVRAFCALKMYRAESPFEAWFCRIALNVAHDYQRSAWRRRVVLWDRNPRDEAEDSLPSSETTALQREMQRRVRQAVAALPDHQRAPIWLVYFEEFTLAEVSRLEGVPESTLRSRVQAGLRRLSLSLEDLVASPAEENPARFDANAKGCGI